MKNMLISCCIFLVSFDVFPGEIKESQTVYPVGENQGNRFSVKQSPDINLRETKDEYVVEMDLPGMDRNNIEVVLLGQRVLEISGHWEKKIEGETYHSTYIREIPEGQFFRTITMPGPADKNATSARYENGVLTVRLPKSHEVEEKRLIPVTG